MPALLELAQCLFHARQQLNFMRGDGLCKRDDAGVLFRRDGLVAELLEAVHQRAAKALYAITELRNRGALAGVQVLADFLLRVDAMVQVGDEGRNGALKVDVVLPQGVVRVEEQCLIGEALKGIGHKEIIGWPCDDKASEDLRCTLLLTSRWWTSPARRGAYRCLLPCS